MYIILHSNIQHSSSLESMTFSESSSLSELAKILSTETFCEHVGSHVPTGTIIDFDFTRVYTFSNKVVLIFMSTCLDHP